MHRTVTSKAIFYRDMYPDYRVAYDGERTYTVHHRRDGWRSDHETKEDARDAAIEYQRRDNAAK